MLGKSASLAPFLRNRFARIKRPSATGELLGEQAAAWGAGRDGARTVATRAQVYALFLVVGAYATLLAVRPRLGLIICLELVAGLYFMTGLHKVWLLVRGDSAGAGSKRVASLKPRDMPVYTILVPLHREGRILPALLDRLQRLDYPRSRLQVLLLVEPDDGETWEAIERHDLPPHIRPMTMPPGGPQTKPRALNVGLREALGEYIVIYDAEDQPDPDQLRKAVAAFAGLPRDVACVQARLLFYNGNQSLLARMFAIDYALWYYQFLPGLTRGLTQPGSFVPLGGTSNHFRVEELRRMGGWDPFNVTEDCDLGVRLGRRGLRVAMLDSTTWEEAVPHARPWVRQRSRWVKGYLQTYLVHMRHPLQLCKQLGPRGFIDFQLLVGASSLLLLINPVMWLLTAVYLTSKGTPTGSFIQSLYPPEVYYPALMSLVLWNFIFFYVSAYVCVRHGFLHLTRYALLTPIYWLLMSAGAWMGFISLIHRPHYWAKTEHGLSLPLPGTVPVMATPRRDT
jgi:cellulose synthase/poly-beta-1,6-N-acetylglucosamine synthase-like glycosyltransferase